MKSITIKFVSLPMIILALSISRINAEQCTLKQDSLASTKLARSKSLEGIYKSAKAFPGCLSGGGISEEVSDDVVVRLSRFWVSSLNELGGARANPAFVSFILNHIDATTSSRDLVIILTNAKTKCPERYNAICNRIEAAAEEALKN